MQTSLKLLARLDGSCRLARSACSETLPGCVLGNYPAASEMSSQSRCPGEPHHSGVFCLTASNLQERKCCINVQNAPMLVGHGPVQAMYPSVPICSGSNGQIHMGLIISQDWSRREALQPSPCAIICSCSPTRCETCPIAAFSSLPCACGSARTSLCALLQTDCSDCCPAATVR